MRLLVTSDIKGRAFNSRSLALKPSRATAEILLHGDSAYLAFDINSTNTKYFLRCFLNMRIKK